MPTVDEIYEKHLAEKAGGDPAKLAKLYVKEIVKAKREADQLDSENADLREKVASTRLPKGHVALPKADADLLAAYKALGEVKDVQAAVAKVPHLEADLADRDFRDSRREVAARLGYAPAVLTLAAPPGVEFVPAKGKDAKTGKEVDTYKVKDTGPDGKERVRTLAEWEADPAVQPLLPALRPSGVQQVVREDGRVVSPSSGYQGSRERARSREQPEPARRAAPVFNAAAAL